MREYCAPRPRSAQALPVSYPERRNALGDLPTTSATPGHAMRVSDFDKARFAVLGQALTGLKEGRGWVQVLVGKQ
jgi:hypothetical protein